MEALVYTFDFRDNFFRYLFSRTAQDSDPTKKRK